MSSHLGSKGCIIRDRKGIINQFGVSPGDVYVVTHCTEVNGKLRAGGIKRRKKETAGCNRDSNYCFQNNKAVQYTGAESIWFREENKH